MNVLENYGFTARFATLAEDYPELTLARVISQNKGIYRIISSFGEQLAEISGKMHHDIEDLIQYPTVGDYVMAKISDKNSNAIIHNLLPRSSVFARVAVGVSGQLQPIVANVDTLFICMSLNQNFNLNRLERYLAIAWDSGVIPVIVLTKSDLCENKDELVSQAERVSLYSDIITISIFDTDVEEKFEKYLKVGTTSAFVGSSGVGKSTVINRLQGEEVMSTLEIGRGDKGRHTTTGRHLLKTIYGGAIIDTPGMRELGADTINLTKTFEDIEEVAVNCKFHDCSHENEPGCAVRLAILNGDIAERHFENYKKLKVESGYEGLSSREIETKKFERFGGVKNLRKIGDEARKNKQRK